ncbi:MAG: TauD/TfdA family dioxygenase [Acidimicrobiales bacterium]|nr:TauD/TfdA family dioxygenase [Acidimicrobiales bacterium]
MTVVKETRTTPTFDPLTPRIGAVISGISCADASDDDVEFVRETLLRHRVVFLRDQHLDGHAHAAFARRFGPLTRAHPTLPSAPDSAELFDLDSAAGAAANHWHTDVTFVERPPVYSFLRAITIPPVGGDTLWANTVAAYGDLRPDLRALANELRAVHTNGADYGRPDVAALRGKLTKEQLSHLERFVSTVYETEHPVVRVHSETGEHALLLGGFAQRLVGHSTTESVDLLRTLNSYAVRPENTVRWRWREGDLAIWDNRATQHYALRDFGSARRRVQRVTTAGAPVLGIDGSTSRALRGDSSDYDGVAA